MSERKQGRRSSQDAEKTKQKILNIALELFCQYGYEGVSLRKISDKADVSHSLIRYHFGSKETIWRYVSDRAHEHMSDYIEAIHQNIPSERPANIKLYVLLTHSLGYMLVFQKPTQLFADAVRLQEKIEGYEEIVSLLEHFIDGAENTHALIIQLIEEYNHTYPEETIDLWDLKWLTINFAHSAVSLTPMMEKAWGKDMKANLFHHWSLFEEIIASKLHIPSKDKINIDGLDDLVDKRC